MKITIETTDNGYIVTGPHPNADREMTEVFEEKETGDKFDVFCLRRVLWSVLELIGYYGSDHDKRRLWVRIIKNGRETD